MNSTRPTLPFGSAVQGTASLHKSLAAQVGRFSGSRNLTHARHFRMVIEADSRPRMKFLIPFKSMVQWPLPLKQVRRRMGGKVRIALVQYNDGCDETSPNAHQILLDTGLHRRTIRFGQRRHRLFHEADNADRLIARVVNTC